jgi:hypothetical protein
MRASQAIQERCSAGPGCSTVLYYECTVSYSNTVRCIVAYDPLHSIKPYILG